MPLQVSHEGVNQNDEGTRWLEFHYIDVTDSGTGAVLRAWVAVGVPEQLRSTARACNCASYADLSASSSLLRASAEGGGCVYEGDPGEDGWDRLIKAAEEAALDYYADHGAYPYLDDD